MKRSAKKNFVEQISAVGSITVCNSNDSSVVFTQSTKFVRNSHDEVKFASSQKQKRFSLCDDSQQLIPASYVVGPPPFTKMTTNQNILPRICRYIHRILHGKGKKGSNFLQYPAKGQFVSNCSRSQVCTYRVVNLD